MFVPYRNVIVASLVLVHWVAAGGHRKRVSPSILGFSWSFGLHKNSPAAFGRSVAPSCTHLEKALICKKRRVQSSQRKAANW
jgi:hypothetical protein